MKRKFKNLYRSIFGEEYPVERYEYVPHVFNKEVVGKAYCSRCGLIALRNPFTEWCIEKGCDAHLHPQYEQKRRQWTALSNTSDTVRIAGYGQGRINGHQ